MSLEHDEPSQWHKQKMMQGVDSFIEAFNEMYEEIPRSALGKMLVKLRVLKRYRERPQEDKKLRVIRVVRFNKTEKG